MVKIHWVRGRFFTAGLIMLYYPLGQFSGSHGSDPLQPPFVVKRVWTFSFTDRAMKAPGSQESSLFGSTNLKGIHLNWSYVSIEW